MVRFLYHTFEELARLVHLLEIVHLPLIQFFLEVKVFYGCSMQGTRCLYDKNIYDAI